MPRAPSSHLAGNDTTTMKKPTIEDMERRLQIIKEKNRPEREPTPLHTLMDPTEARMRFPFAWERAQQCGMSLDLFMEQDHLDVVLVDIFPSDGYFPKKK